MASVSAPSGIVYHALRQHGKHGDKLAQFGHVHGLAVGIAGSDVLPALLGKVLNNSHQRIGRTAERAVQLSLRAVVQIRNLSVYIGVRYLGPICHKPIPFIRRHVCLFGQDILALGKSPVLLGHKGAHQLQALGGNRFWRGLGDTALLDAHIHDIAHEVGQIKIHGGLAEHQHDGRQREADIGL